jgi:hypothetical protein
VEPRALEFCLRWEVLVSKLGPMVIGGCDREKAHFALRLHRKEPSQRPSTALIRFAVKDLIIPGSVSLFAVVLHHPTGPRAPAAKTPQASASGHHLTRQHMRPIDVLTGERTRNRPLQVPESGLQRQHVLMSSPPFSSPHSLNRNKGDEPVLSTHR